MCQTSREERRWCGKVEKDVVGPDDTRHRHIKSTLSKYTIIFITPARDLARSEYQARNTVTNSGYAAPRSKFRPAFLLRPFVFISQARQRAARR